MEMKNSLPQRIADSFDVPPYSEEYLTEGDERQKDDIEFYIQKIGPAPTDYHIVAQTMVIQPPMVKPVYVLCWCHPEDLTYYVSDYPVLKDGKLLPQEERHYPREEYTEIEDAGKSGFFKTLFRIDKAVDKKIEELKEHELDTKYAPYGLRIGASWQRTFNLYGEAYNRTQPEHHEYVQVMSQDGKYTYSASHTSYARQYELGAIYNGYFGNPPKQEYFVKIKSIKELDPEFSYFAICFKTLQHKMMNEMLEVGMPLYEMRGKELPYDPILTSVRGAPGKTVEGQLAEATIDVNSYQRVYVIAVNTKEQEHLFVSSRSLYLESMPNMYHAFDFDWQNVILKEFPTRDEAECDLAYGMIYTALFRLLDGVKQTKSPYIWRNGCDDLYGFSRIVLSKGIGAEQHFEPLSNNKPQNLNLMMQPHP